MGRFPQKRSKTKTDYRNQHCGFNVSLSNLLLYNTNEVIKKRPVISMKRTFLFQTDLIKMFFDDE